MPFRRSPLAAQKGFSIAELMVGMTIGLLAILIMQTMAVQFSSQKRASSGGADAQNTGMMAMNTLESDIRLGGYGLASLDTLYCNMQTTRVFNGRRYMPVAIIPDGVAAASPSNLLGIPPGDAGSDIVAVMYGNSSTVIEGAAISQLPSTTSYGLNVSGMNLNDFVMVGQASQPCTVARITGPSPLSSPITVDTASGAAAYVINSTNVFNLGNQGMTMNVYAIRGGDLTVCDFWTSNCADPAQVAPAWGGPGQANPAVWVPIANNVVGMRAQYGWDTSAPPNMTVDAFCRSRLTSAAPACPTPDPGTVVPNSACDWTRVAAIRLALVVRSAERGDGNTVVSPANITLWPDSAVAPTTTGPVFAVPSRNYRYKVFQSDIPIRNVIWHGAEASCP